MKEIKYTITDENGIHARPAGVLVKKAKEFNSNIKITKVGKSADAKKLFNIMGLAVKQGDEIVITIEGDDEATATQELEKFLSENL
ncbi:MAG: HPr family phosphocarrier protein [Oscillospiraceae bacterium]